MAALTTSQKAKLLQLHEQMGELCRYMPLRGGLRDSWMEDATVLLIEARTLIEANNVFVEGGNDGPS